MFGLFLVLLLRTRGTRAETWVVVVGTSRYWANYRHAANALIVEDIARRFGVTKTLVMIAEPCACSARNPVRGWLYLGRWLDASRIHYGGEQASVRNFKDVLTGRRPGLDSGPSSNVLLYLTGHGGDQFLKFHDADEINSHEIAAALKEMRLKLRYRKMLLIIDTCQAASLFSQLETNSSILGIASSLVGENAYAAPPDPIIGVSLADRFTFALAQYFDDHHISGGTIGALVDYLATAPTRSTLVVHHTSWGSEDWRSTPLTDFFADVPSNNKRPVSAVPVSEDDLHAVFGSVA